MAIWAAQNNVNLDQITHAQAQASFDDLVLRFLQHFFVNSTNELARLSSPPVNLDALLSGIDDLLIHSRHIVSFLDEVVVRAVQNFKEAEGGGTTTNQEVAGQREGNLAPSLAPSCAAEIVAVPRAVPVELPPGHKTKTPTCNKTHSPALPPHRDYLVLDEGYASVNLSPLFGQALPSLQELKISQYRSAQDEQESEQQLTPWDRSLPSPDDHQLARTFFSRLKAFYLDMCDVGFDVAECHAFIDMAHEGLRAIYFPRAVPDHLAAQFFARCSRAFTVITIPSSQLSLSTWEIFTANCTSVRTLGLMGMYDESDVDADGLASFLEVRGKGLVALDLNLGDSQLKEDCLKIIRKRGGTIKNLELVLPSAEQVLTDTDDLIRSIADCCPNLEQLHL
ncbi:hypothetical protein HK102_013565 [Quaeritorhiza haematococci]|nr:hypothetical protein HK102_013565 [Quaeritorhiza haematococci]